MSLNKFMLSIFLLPCFIYGIVFYSMGELTEGDFIGYLIDDYEFYIKVFIGEIICIVLLYYLVLGITKIRTPKLSLKETRRKSLILFWGVFILQISYFIYSYTTGVDVLSVKQDVQVNNPLKYIFTFLNPNVIFYLYFLKEENKKRLFIVLCAFLFSNIFRGWITGVALQVFILFLIKYLRTGYIKFKYIFIVIFLFFMMAPSLYFIKYASRGHEIITLESYMSYYTAERYSSILSKIMARFQHTSETYVILDKIEQIETARKEKEFVPFYADNMVKKTFASLFNYQPYTFNEYIARKIDFRQSGNIHSGILPWLSLSFGISIIYLLFVCLSIFSWHFLLSFIQIDKRIVQSTVLWFSLFYIMPGWFFAVPQIILGLIFISLFYAKKA